MKKGEIGDHHGLHEAGIESKAGCWTSSCSQSSRPLPVAGAKSGGSFQRKEPSHNTPISIRLSAIGHRGVRPRPGVASASCSSLLIWDVLGAGLRPGTGSAVSRHPHRTAPPRHLGFPRKPARHPHWTLFCLPLSCAGSAASRCWIAATASARGKIRGLTRMSGAGRGQRMPENTIDRHGHLRRQGVRIHHHAFRGEAPPG